jgi:predicted DNA-binding transcriptional regulator YafY
LSRSEGELSVGELVRRLGLSQRQVSNDLACLRWCGFTGATRDGRTIYSRIADERVGAMLDLAQSLLADNAEHVASCCRLDDRCGRWSRSSYRATSCARRPPPISFVRPPGLFV